MMLNLTYIHMASQQNLIFNIIQCGIVAVSSLFELITTVTKEKTYS